MGRIHNLYRFFKKMPGEDIAPWKAVPNHGNYDYIWYMQYTCAQGLRRICCSAGLEDR